MASLFKVAVTVVVIALKHKVLRRWRPNKDKVQGHEPFHNTHLPQEKLSTRLVKVYAKGT